MKTLFLLLQFSLFVNINVNSQTIDWLNYNQDEVNLTSTIVKVNSNGEIFRLSESKLDKINQFGTVIKTLSYLPEIVSFDFDTSQNLLLLGRFKGNVDVNPDPLIYIPENSMFYGGNWPLDYNTALIVLKLDNDLNYISHFKIDESIQDVYFEAFPHEIKIDNENAIYIATNAANGLDVDPSTNSNILTNLQTNNVLLKYQSNTNGFNLIWVKYLPVYSGIENFSPKKTVMDIDEIGSSFITIVNSDSVLITGFDKNGNLRTSFNNFRFNGFQNEYIDDIEVINENRIVVGGHYLNNININPNPNSTPIFIQSAYPYIQTGGSGLTYPSFADAFMAVYDSSFNLLWHKVISHKGNDIIDDIEYKNGLIFVTNLSENHPVSIGISSGNTPGLINNCSFARMSQLQIYDTLGNLIRKNLDVAPYPNSYLMTNSNIVSSDPNSTSSTPPCNDFLWGRKSICVMDSNYFILSTFNARSGGLTQYWNDNFNWKSSPCSTSDHYISPADSTYSVLVKYILDIPVTLQEPMISQGDSMSYCLGQSISLSLLPYTMPSCDYFIEWTKFSNQGTVISNYSSFSFVPQGSGYYFVKIKSYNGMISLCDSIYIQLSNDNLNLNVGPVLLITQPYIVTIQNNTPNFNSYNFVWNMGDGTSFTNNNSVFTYEYPIGEHNYTITCTATSFTGCQLSQTWTVSVFSGSGINEVINEQIKVYPNPFDVEFSISSLNEISLMKIYDFLGRSVDFSIHDKNTINCNKLSSGTYVLQVIDIKGNTLNYLIQKK